MPAHISRRNHRSAPSSVECAVVVAVDIELSPRR
jgi:hypothetical protein